MTPRQTPDAVREAEPLGPIWRKVAAVQRQAMSEDWPVERWRNAILAALDSRAGEAGEVEAEVARIMAMSDDEIMAEADAEDVAWARAFKQGLRTGQHVSTAGAPVKALRSIVAKHTRVGGYPDTYAIASDAYNLALSATPAPAVDAAKDHNGGRCPDCDDTGDVHRIDCEWLGTCHCPAGNGSAATAVPAGWKLVPIEPTSSMLDAAGLVFIEIYPTNIPSCLTATNSKEAREIWSEMLAASPVSAVEAVPADVFPKTIGRVHLGEHQSDGECLCSHGHPVPAGHPLYWPQQISQYDDSDPLCLTHAIDQLESDNADWGEDYEAVDAVPAGEVERLREALRSVRDDLHNKNGLNLHSIVDTIWHGPAETTVDFIDAALSHGEGWK